MHARDINRGNPSTLVAKKLSRMSNRAPVIDFSNGSADAFTVFLPARATNLVACSTTSAALAQMPGSGGVDRMVPPATHTERNPATVSCGRRQVEHRPCYGVTASPVSSTV